MAYYIIDVAREQKEALVALGIDVVGAQNTASNRTTAVMVLMRREDGASRDLLRSVMPRATEISSKHLSFRCGVSVVERIGSFYIERAPAHSGEPPVTATDGELNRFVVPVRCIKPEGIEPTTVIVFASSQQAAREAATQKMADKYLRNQNLETQWDVTGEPEEG
jgi:hypothetical protein